MSSNKKKTLQIKAQLPDMKSLKIFNDKLTSMARDRFTLKYGRILDLLEIPVQVDAVTALAQFYDPPLRCFTFQDFQLAPTLEEFGQILDFSRKKLVPYKRIGQVPKLEDLAVLLKISDLNLHFKTERGASGFRRDYLEMMATNFAKDREWESLGEVLALLIFGLVLFPNQKNFIDVAAISVFWAVRVNKEDPVPALLADVYYTLHMRYENRGGLMLCCIPLLYSWFISQISENVLPSKTLKRLEWSQKIVSLTEGSILWYARKINEREVTISCGDFPNVPLIGSRGCINYNPILAIRQLGYPMVRKPDDEALKEFVLRDTDTNDPRMLQKIIQSWTQVHRKGNELRKRDIVKEPYSHWIKERVKKIGLPFILTPSSQPSPPEPMPTSIEEVNELKATIERLEKEKGDLQQQLYHTTHECNKFKFHFEEKRKQLAESIKRTEEEKAKKERVDDCLAGVTNEVKERNRRLDKAWKENKDWKDLWEHTLRSRKEMRERFEARILDLTTRLQESQTLASNECRLREESDRIIQNLPTNWKELLIDLRNLKEHERQQRQDFEAMEDRAHHLETRKPRTQLVREPAFRHSHQTRANKQRAMEQIEQNHALMRVEVDDMKEKMDKILEIVQNMANNPQPVVNTPWPTYGLPPGYVPPEDDSNVPPPLETIAIPVVNATNTSHGVSNDPNGNTSPCHATEGVQLVQSVPTSATLAVDHVEDEAAQKYKALEERLKAIEGFSAFGIDALDMCLVPDVVVPPKFKTPDFEKYKGLQCPKIHLKRFCTKMSAHITNEKLMMHVFQDSLSGASLDWYMQLERTQIQTWKDLMDAFLTQYKYNIGVAPTRMHLQGMSQKSGESFKEYAQRWREVAARVLPPLLEKELVDTFMSTLHGPYYEKMIGSISSNFADLVTIGERVEEGIKNGKIQGVTSAQAGAKKFFGGPPKKKEGETNAILIGPSERPPVQLPYLQYPYVAAIAQGQYQQPAYPMRPPQHPLVVPPQGQPQQNRYQPRNQPEPRNNYEKKAARFDHVPIPYGQILPYLLQKGLVELKSLPPMVPPYPPYYDANAKCDYHAGSPGHNIENCKAFKYKVQELLDRKLISFKEEGPNVKTNPLPGHASSSVNAIEEVEELDSVKEVSKIKTPLSVVRERLIGFELFEKLHSGCKDCLVNPASCQGMKESLQKLMDQGLVQIGYSKKDADIAVVESQGPAPFEIPYQRVEVQIPINKVDPMVFHVPAPFSFKSTKEVPWNYSPIVSIGEVEEFSRPTNQVRALRMHLLNPLREKPWKRLGWESAHQVSSPKKTIPQGEAEEFLRIIRKSDYKIIDQLGQTPSKISMLSLLLSSEAHRDTLLKILNEAHVTKDITVDQFDGVVANITTSRYLGFNEDELPSGGHDHNKALNISVKCLDNIFSKVLVDTGSSLNVMPKTTLDKLASEEVSIRPSSLIVKAFDGSKRAVMGEVDLPILIGPQLFTITFQIMDINPSYSCLLGRLWIHAARAITSTLHQKLKFIAGDKMIVVSGQEDMMVSHLSSFRYIEADDEAFEVPFQALEIATITTLKTKRKSSKKGGLAMTSWKAMKEALEEGIILGWGKVPEICEKKDRFGLGYRPTTKGMMEAAQRKMGTLQEIFCSAGFIYEGHVAMLEDGDEDVPNLVHQCVPNEVLRNWKAWEIPEVVFKSTNISIETNTVIIPIDFEFPINQAEEGDEDNCELPEGLARLLEQEEKEIQPHQEPIEVINLGTHEVKKEIKIGASLQEDSCTG
ncbi:hypothetical protein TSUD_398050, partial [Trifolium subterraneum]